MNDTIDPIIDRLMKIDLFSHSGTNDIITCGSFSFTHVDSWHRACDLRGSIEGSNAFLEARNRLTIELGTQHQKAYKQWNVLMGKYQLLMEKHLFPLLDARINSLLDLQLIEGGANLVKSSVLWDFYHFTAEQVYSELVDPGFFTYLIPIYEKGYFPCFWDEVWPGGLVWIL